MKTSKEEQERRIIEFKKDLEIYSSWLKKIKEEENLTKKDLLLGCKEFITIRDKFMFGPTYIIWKEDFNDPEYKMASGDHPSNIEILNKIYKSGYYGAIVKERDNDCLYKCVALAYDYGDYYFVVEEINKPGEYKYITLCAPVEIVVNNATDK